MVTERGANVSRADLLRCLLAGKGQELDGVAAALGFTREVRPEISSLPVRHIPPVIDMETPPPAELLPLPKELPPVEQERMHFYRVTKREPLNNGDESPSDYPAWYTDSDETLLDQGRVSLVPEHQKLKFQPLVPWARLWPFLHNTLSNLCSGWQPDMDQVVKRVAQGELLRRMPLKSRKTWAGSACVLVDINAGTFGLRYDFIHLRDKLLRLRGEYGLRVRYLEDEPGGQVYHWEHEREVVEPWVTPPPDVPLLIISDLGALTQSRRKLYAWLVFGRELAAKGCRPVVLMPVPVRMIDARLLKYFTCISWDRGSRLQPVMNVRPDNIAPDEHQAKVRQLLNRLAPAVRVNSSLLRATRYLLASEAFDVGHEAAVWQHPAIQNHGDEFVWQMSDHEQFLQAFRQLPAPQQQAMVDFIARYHATLPEVVYFEAMQNCIQLSPEQVDTEVREATRRYMAALVRTFNEHPEYKGLSQWTGRFVDRQQADVLRQHNAILAAIKGIRLRHSLETGKEIPFPEGFDKELMQPFLSGVKQPRHYELRQQGRKLVFVPEGGAESDDGFGAQGSLLTTLNSSVDFIVKNSTTQQDLQASHILRFERDKTATVAMAGTRSYELETDRERISVEPLTKPEWAVAIGNDVHGLWAESKDHEGHIHRWYWHPMKAGNTLEAYDHQGFPAGVLRFLVNELMDIEASRINFNFASRNAYGEVSELITGIEIPQVNLKSPMPEVFSDTVLIKNIILFDISLNKKTSLDVLTKVNTVRDLLAFHQFDEKFELHFYSLTMPKDFLSVLARYDQSIIHFVGHDVKHELFVKNNNDQENIIALEYIIDAMRIYRHNIECVIFDADYFNHHVEALSEFIPVVISVNRSVNIQTAKTYITGFYRSIFGGESFETAHQVGVVGIGNEREAYQIYSTPRKQLNRFHLLNGIWPNYMQLRSRLSGRLPKYDELRWLCRQCFPLGKMGILPKTDNKLEILDWLAERSLSGGSPPPLLIFLMLLRRSLEPELDAFVNGWLENACIERGIILDDLLLHQRYDAPIYVLVEIRFISKDSSYYCSAGAWLLKNNQWTLVLVRDGRDAINLHSRESLAQFIGDLVSALDQSLLDRYELVTLEFVLPIELVSMEIDCWQDLNGQVLGLINSRTRKNHKLRFWRPTVNSNRIIYTITDKFPKSWASHWGEDEYGLWMAFTYKDVKQVFRWIEPGSFIMGSPENEPDREPNGADETQKEVTFSQGFWIADVPVTQALWEAVMGKNPSNFPNPDCPVENINWDEAQAFISRMNEMKPELKLCLPLEAQWEYACRAGTTSPFYFGNQITSTLANFDGSNPYNGGEVSEFRQQTVKVKSFPPNAWGLYEMHGNVWEWCQDEYGLNIPGEDPSIIRRVLKGGSWLSNGSDCRSAHRSRIVQTHRHSTYGFRLALFSEDFSIEENWFVDEQDENQSWFWEEEARRVVESALENSDWDEESKSITLTAPDDERHSEVVRNRDQLESFLTAIAGSALYANAPRDEGDFILIDNDEYAIVAEILEEYEQRLEEFFSEDE